MDPTCAIDCGHWVHDLSPFIFRIRGEFGLRWYGLAYVAGIVLGALLAKRWIRRGRIPLRQDELWDLAMWVGISMIIGGRLGYYFFYYLPDPAPGVGVGGHLLYLFQVWKGGMASHGGIIGIAVGAFAWSWRNKRHLLVMGETAAVAAPIGVVCGRIANFINGELYGRPGDVPWAMHFPSSMHEVPSEQLPQRFATLREALPELTERYPSIAELQMHLEPGSPAYDTFYRIMTEPRHPSQLYAAMLEGLLVLAVALPVFARVRRPGFTGGVVLVTYGIGRFVGEFFRQWDTGTHLILGLSRGQWLTIPFFLIGIGLMAWSWHRGPRPDAYLPPEGAAPQERASP